MTTTAGSPARSRGNPIPMLIIGAIVLTFVVMLFSGADPFTLFLVDPLLNLLLFINLLTLGNFGLAIILFTILLRIATIPFTIRQLESTKAMQAMQPLQAEIQKKYKDPKRRQEELMKLYKEHHINPLGCFVPLLIQFVVFGCLYRALAHMAGGTPESLVSLSHRVYAIDLLQNQIPLNQHFLWLNMGKTDPTMAIPLLVGLTTYVQQRMSITPTNNPQQQQQQQMMTWMLPLMLMFITLNLPSGVGVYWVISTVFSLFASYYVYGRRVLSWRQLLPVPLEAPAPAASGKRPDGRPSGRKQADVEVEASASDAEEHEPDISARREARSEYGKRRGKRKKRR
jgi:YidC/Oxa1 family membrane protein insertase